jgi:UTP--glucose-1-phosphate uridylyltransferase
MVEKAVIPAAGEAVRLRPVSRVLPKGLFPLVGPGGQVRAVLHWILLEAARAGLKAAGVIVAPDRLEMFREYFASLGADERAPLPEREWILQPSPAGFGDAVARAEAFTGDEPFLLMLGDHVYATAPSRPSCAAQVVAAFDAHGPAAMIGVRPVGGEELSRVGVCRGERIDERVFRGTGFIEKPDPAAAARDLRTPGEPQEQYLGHAGLYVFRPEIYRHLAKARRPQGQLELAAAQAALLAEHPEDYLLCRLDGRVWDVGTPEGYAQAAAEFPGTTGRRD